MEQIEQLKMLQWSKINTKEKCMSSITNEIVAIKTEVRERNWEEMSLACRKNGINASTYYARLRKLREKLI